MLIQQKPPGLPELAVFLIKQLELYQKIQQSIDQKAENESQDVVSFHQQKIREKIKGYNETPTITNSQDSFNIWNDEQQLDGNIIENYTLRFRSFDNFIQNNISQDEIASNILKLLGMKHKMKNLGKIPFFKEQPQQSTNYFVPPQKAYRLFKKRPLNFTSTQQNSNQTFQLINSKSRLNSLEIQNLNQTNQRQLSSPDILKIKFKQLKMK
ncbi:unnamed protein product (macronuclear) [Paramecium tetraurelia]|uniref:Uncharacterized protein n=1 Tax=Paramecium tetraurelia TaxID=5888 RepID=A0DV99_PARTE|nr:uncharacterized protein GSPATT00020630001 [Paramecium tetraurelia]CAK86966.1 unnamed protein product [Paramecium tetraurelia]|eukprot:XP_001454363.1 hypothetical protein (macronuclear) [Paramecium tetraurelia strain d4-2]